jgi:hypothetical protein
MAGSCPLCSGSFQHIDVDSSMLCCRIRKSHGSSPLLLPLGHLIDLVLLLMAFQESGDVPNHLYLAEVGVAPMSSAGAIPLRSEPGKWEAPAIYWRYQTVS